MLLKLGRRALQSLPTLLGVTLVSFFMIRMIPGDPALMLVGERGASEVELQATRARLGLDQPVLVQYALFLKGVISGDLGTSIVTNRSVLSEFWSRFPATIELSFFALLLAVLAGLPLGIFAALHRGKLWDYLLMGGALIGYSMPIFWWGLLLILFFSVTLGWTPVSGRISVLYDVEIWSGFFLIDVWRGDEPWEAFWASLQHMILPAVALGTVPLAAIARMTRSSMLEVLKEDYIRTAKAKGLPHRLVVTQHALRNALIPIVTMIGLMVGTLLTGAILTETIFSWPGIGKWVVSSIMARDYPAIQGGLLLIAFVVVGVNFVVDSLYLLISPHMRES